RAGHCTNAASGGCQVTTAREGSGYGHRFGLLILNRNRRCFTREGNDRRRVNGRTINPERTQRHDETREPHPVHPAPSFASKCTKPELRRTRQGASPLARLPPVALD